MAGSSGRLLPAIAMKKYLPYVIGLLLLGFFCCWEFGPVVRHLAEENYFSFEALPMTYVLSLPLGKLYWAGRFLMLPFQWQWVGGLYLALLLTLSAWLTDRALSLSGRWRGVGFVLPAAVLGWASYRGYNLFLRNEPSQLILWVYGLLVLSAVAALVATLLRRRAKTAEASTAATTGGMKQMLGTCIGALALLLLCGGTYAFRSNLLASCEMQNLMLDEEWEEMADVALNQGLADRSVAAYHVIAVTRMNQTLERTFEIAYDYPTVVLDSIGGLDEGVNYIAECNLHAGLIQPAYHYALEQTVMAGPRLRYYKIMAIAAMLNDEQALCEKMLHLIDKMPMQHDFVVRVREKLGKVEDQRNDPTLGSILQLAPLESKFEQNYRQPMFLGYSVGVMEGSNATLDISVAAALYSKDMENIILRAEFLQQKRPLPICVQQALVLASLRREGLLDRFPSISTMVKNEVQQFLMAARPLTQDKTKDGKEVMKRELINDWLGSYMYYYYCGNLNQTVQRKAETAVN